MKRLLTLLVLAVLAAGCVEALPESASPPPTETVEGLTSANPTPTPQAMVPSPQTDVSSQPAPPVRPPAKEEKPIYDLPLVYHFDVPEVPENIAAPSPPIPPRQK